MMMRATRQDLFEFLDRLGITTSTVNHPPLFTVTESRSLRGEIPGGHTKNLFVRDKKGRHFLLTVEEDAVVDLKQVHRLIGATGRVSFGKPESIMELLGVEPGSVTVFGLINDREKALEVILDTGVMKHDVINAHPLTNEATTSIAREDLLRFIAATGHEPQILKITG